MGMAPRIEVGRTGSGPRNEFERGKRFPGQTIDGQNGLRAGSKFEEQ